MAPRQIAEIELHVTPWAPATAKGIIKPTSAQPQTMTMLWMLSHS